MIRSSPNHVAADPVSNLEPRNNQLDDGGADVQRDGGEQSGDLALTCINETELLLERGFTLRASVVEGVVIGGALVSLAGLTTLVSQVTEPSSEVTQSASILLSLPVALPGPRSHPSV